MDVRFSIFGADSGEIDTAISQWGWPRFRAGQVRDWIYNKLVADPADMSNLSKADRGVLAERAEFATGVVAANQLSSDGTRKILLRWPDGASAETVMIPDGDRCTACVSSQVGCPVGCRFCASGIDGLVRNLTAARIVEQVFALNRLLLPEEKRIGNIVFMGMGEPLSNYANVIKAVRVLHDPGCFNIGARKITISTVGVPPRMRQLAEEDLPLNLAISLHAPDEALRKQLIPWAEHFSLEDILSAARYYFEKTGREITLEYILLGGVNDSRQHAQQLGRICKTLRANVNLIRYNPVMGLGFERPDAKSAVDFQAVLRRFGINAHARKSRGRDIDAACGQLRRKASEPVSAQTA